MKPTAVALIPARSGSKRIPDKNVRRLGDHPLLAYSVCAALDSGVFDAVVCATDSEAYADVARHYGAAVPALRPAAISGEKSPDIEWILWILTALREQGRSFDAFSILRPTSPFRLPATIQRAWRAFTGELGADSLRAVEKCRQHPGKMWVVRGRRMLPVMPFSNGTTPWHSSQYAALPDIYVQNASLEFAWCRVPLESGSIAGESIVPFVSEGFEGFDVNDPEDWVLAERYFKAGEASLPAIARPPFHATGQGSHGG